MRKKAKKILIAILIIIALAIILYPRHKTTPPTPNPEPYNLSYLEGKTSNSGFPYEMDYGNITAATEKISYDKSVEDIICTVTNNNPEHAFYVNSIPVIEKYRFGKWVRLVYYPYDYYWETGRWSEIIGNEGECFSTVLHFYPEYLEGGLSKGKYRLVVFVGDTKTYAEFEVTK